MRGKIKSVSILIVLCMSLIMALTSCGTPISKEEAMQSLKTAVENSMNAQVYYYKEVSLEKDKINNKMNVYAKQDKDGSYLVDDKGNFIDYSIRYETSINSKNVVSMQAGKSNGSAGEKEFLFKKDFDIEGKNPKVTMQEYPTNQVLSTSYFSDKILSYKIRELSLLELKDMNFDVKNSKLEKKGYLRVLKFQLNDSFYKKVEETYNMPSVLKGDMLEIEIAYDRISAIIVYNNEKLDENINFLEEKYRLEIVYMGPKENIPSYDNEGFEYGTIIK